MNYYITGSKGYIGSRLKDRLQSIKELKYIQECDLKMGRDVMTYQPDGDIDVIYHLAAQSGVPESMDDPVNDARQNILATMQMINLANLAGAKLIFTTSGAAVEPESPYGLSKKTCEEYIKMLCDDYVIVRLSSVYGNKPKGVVDNFLRADECIIFGDGSAERDFVHVDDIVGALVLAQEWKKGTYDLGSGYGTTIAEIAKATKKKIVRYTPRDGEKQSVVLSNTTPNWEPKINVISWIESQIK